jgi:hypothetical protein
MMEHTDQGAERTAAPALTLVDVLGLLLLLALQVWGVLTYLIAQVNTPTWLWENQDYMMFLWPVYYHLHIALLIGHMYLWGPYLIARLYRSRWWFLYAVSFLCAYALTGYPLLAIERFRALHGTAAYSAAVVYYVLLFALFAYRLVRPGSVVKATAFHLFSGLPIIFLGLYGPSTLGIPNGIVAWALLVFHVVVYLYVIGVKKTSQQRAYPEPGISWTSGVAGGFALVAVGALCVAYKPVQLFFARRDLERLLDGVGYGLKPVAPPLAANASPPANYLRFRTYDGSWNNLSHPEVGQAGTPLGRYMPASADAPHDVLAAPSVVTVSNTLLKQTDFQSAAPFNALAMAWVNFLSTIFITEALPTRLRMRLVLLPSTTKFPSTTAHFFTLSN